MREMADADLRIRLGRVIRAKGPVHLVRLYYETQQRGGRVPTMQVPGGTQSRVQLSL